MIARVRVIDPSVLVVHTHCNHRFAFRHCNLNKSHCSATTTRRPQVDVHIASQDGYLDLVLVHQLGTLRCSVFVHQLGDFRCSVFVHQVKCVVKAKMMSYVLCASTWDPPVFGFGASTGDPPVCVVLTSTRCINSSSALGDLRCLGDSDQAPCSVSGNSLAPDALSTRTSCCISPGKFVSKLSLLICFPCVVDVPELEALVC